MKRKIYVEPCIEVFEVDVELMMVSDSGTNTYTNKIKVNVDNTTGSFGADVKENNVVDFGEDDGWK